MINVNEVYEYINFLARKNKSGGVFTPREFNLVLPRVVLDIVRKYYGVPEEYQVTRPQAHISADITQLVRDYLSTLKPTVTLPCVDGIVTLPSDYIHKSSAVSVSYGTEVIDSEDSCDCVVGGCTCNNDVDTKTKKKSAKNRVTVTSSPIVFLSDTQYDWYNNSVTRKPSIEYPIAKMIPNGIMITPNIISKINLTYYRYPLVPVWNYTTSNGVVSYDAVNSVNIELPNICGTEVVLSMLDKLGISIRENGLINWAERTRQKGT